jgi:hypothetical protein
VHLSGNDNDARALKCKVNNYARIIDPVGAPKNTQAADDQGFWSYDLPARLCEPPPVPLIDPACPASLRRVGNDCLPFVPPPPPTCPDGQSLSNGRCCPSGLTWTGRRCGQVTEQCPPGTRGQPPHCYWVDPPRRCPSNSVGQWPSCRKVVIEKCPRGTTGQWPSCKRPVVEKCPSGMVGKPPNCRTVQVNRTKLQVGPGRNPFTPGRQVPLMKRFHR